MERNQSLTGKLMAHGCLAGLAAFVFALFLGRSLILRDRYFEFIGMALSGAFLLSVLLWTCRAMRRFGSSEAVVQAACQFLVSCVIFSMLCIISGIAISGLIWYSHDLFRAVGAFWFGVCTCVGIFVLRRDARRLSQATASS